MPRRPDHPTSERLGIIAAVVAQYATEMASDAILDWLAEAGVVVLDVARALRDWWRDE